MKILGIETSSIVCSVGIVDDKGYRDELRMVDPHIHSEKLLSLIHEVLNRSGWRPSSLDGISVSAGPGSFTGLRIGMSTAKGLCLALNIPLLSVPTFDAIARSVSEHMKQPEYLVIAVDAKQGEFYVAEYEVVDSMVRPLKPICTLRLSEFQWQKSNGLEMVVVSDRGTEVAQHANGKKTVHEFMKFCRGDVIALLGQERCERKEFADLATVEPVYLKDFVVKNTLS
jgi:tRNA threonylcarbamoyladenosine biosynthesis protein TsaB